MQLSKSAKLGLWAFLAVDLILVLVFAALLLARQERQQASELRELGVSNYPQPVELADFLLMNERGQAFTNEDLLGRWSLIFFGFTSCPDICPLTMTELAQFRRTLDQQQLAPVPQVILATLDPDRDTPAAMASYLDDYHPDFIGLSGDMQELNKLAQALYVAYSLPEDHLQAQQPHAPVMAHYNIDHSGHFSLINPEGQLVAVFRAPHRDQDILRAWQLLQAN